VKRVSSVLFFSEKETCQAVNDPTGLRLILINLYIKQAFNERPGTRQNNINYFGFACENNKSLP